MGESAKSRAGTDTVRAVVGWHWSVKEGTMRHAEHSQWVLTGPDPQGDQLWGCDGRRGMTS